MLTCNINVNTFIIIINNIVSTIFVLKQMEIRIYDFQNDPVNQ